MGWCSLRGHRNGLAAGTVGCRADGMGLGLVRVAVKKEASWPPLVLVFPLPTLHKHTRAHKH